MCIFQTYTHRHSSSFLRLNLPQRPGKLKLAKFPLVSNTGCVNNIAFYPQLIDSGDVPLSMTEPLLSTIEPHLCEHTGYPQSIAESFSAM